jgi:hypothetical protein
MKGIVGFTRRHHNGTPSARPMSGIVVFRTNTRPGRQG